MNTDKISVETLNEILEILQENEHVTLDKIELDSTHNSIYYKDMITMPVIDIQYNDIKWILNYFCEEEIVDKIMTSCKKINVPVFDYVGNVIQCEKLELRFHIFQRI